MLGELLMKCDLEVGYNIDLQTQMKILENILIQSKPISTAIERAQGLGIENYYLGAGCITQTVWNYLSGRHLEYGIKDIDFVYFDEANLDFEKEDFVIKKVRKLYEDLNFEIDVKNQARVHIWYKSHFGVDIKPYKSIEEAINTWPTTATAIGVRREGKLLKIYAPFGLNDLFGMIVRPNKTQITKEVYENKVSRWITQWPDLNIIPWEK
jgi:hypothetical protein